MTGSQEAFQKTMNQGHSAAWDQMWEQAAECYREALEIIPGQPQALNCLGLALVELQEYDQAYLCYIEAAKALPEDPMPLEKVSQISEQVGRIDKATQASLRAAELHLKNREVHKAIENWERAKQLNPQNLQARTRLALVYERMEEKQKSVTEYLAAASLFQGIGDMEKAKQAVDQALRILPSDKDAINASNLLKDFKQLPKPDQSPKETVAVRKSRAQKYEVIEEKQVESDPISQACNKALTVLAGMLFEGVDNEKDDLIERRGFQAIVTGTGMLRKPLDRDRMMMHLSQMVELQTKKDYDQAVEELQRAIDFGLEHPAAFFDLGYMYQEIGRIESAIRQLHHSINHIDFALASRLLLGELLSQKGQIDQASIEYLYALQLADTQAVTPEYANDLKQLYDLFIESYRRSHNSELQTKLCENIHGLLMRQDWKANLSRARDQITDNNFKAPPTPLAEILSESGVNRVLESISNINQLAEKGYFHSAMEETFFALEQAPTYLPIHSMMGEILSKQGKTQQAINKFESVARAYSIRGEPQHAIGYFQRIVELAPTDIKARQQFIDQLIAFGKIENAMEEYIQLADVYISLADLNLARKSFREALKLTSQPNANGRLRVMILRRIVDIDMQSLDWRQALISLDQIRTLQPDDKEVRLSLIQLYLRLGEEQQALTELDNYMGYLSLSKKENEGLIFMENLVTESPTNLSFRRRLIDQYHEMGRTEDEIVQLNAVREILTASGETASVIQVLERILSLDPLNKKEYQELLRRLRQEQSLA